MLETGEVSLRSNSKQILQQVEESGVLALVLFVFLVKFSCTKTCVNLHKNFMQTTQTKNFRRLLLQICRLCVITFTANVIVFNIITIIRDNYY